VSESWNDRTDYEADLMVFCYWRLKSWQRSSIYPPLELIFELLNTLKLPVPASVKPRPWMMKR
jgi:hypothetical protein